MAAYHGKAQEAALKLNKFIGKTLTEKDLAEIYYTSIKTMPWRGAIAKVKCSAAETFALKVGNIKVKHVKRTGRDGETYDDIEFEQDGIDLNRLAKAQSEEGENS